MVETMRLKCVFNYINNFDKSLLYIVAVAFFRTKNTTCKRSHSVHCDIFAFHVWLKYFLPEAFKNTNERPRQHNSKSPSIPLFSVLSRLLAIVSCTLDDGYMLLSKLPVFLSLIFTRKCLVLDLTCCNRKTSTLDTNLLWTADCSWCSEAIFNLLIPIRVQNKLISLHCQRHVYWRAY